MSSGVLEASQDFARFVSALSRTKLLVRAIVAIFGGPGGASSTLFRSSWPIFRSKKPLRGVPGLISEAEMSRFSTFVASEGFVPARPSDPYETLRGRTNFKLRAFARRSKNVKKSLRKRIRQCCLRRTCSAQAPGPSASILGEARARCWTSPGRLWLARGVPRLALERHLGFYKPSRAHLDASPTRPWAPRMVQD